MAVLHLPDNIKVHFAGCEVQNQFIAVESLGIRYGLYTAFPFVEKMVFGKTSAPIMPQKWMSNPAKDIPTYINQTMLHTIQDSGLFTLMFGARSGKHDSHTINKWYDGLVEYTHYHGLPVTCVEVDCQKVLGVDAAWEFRERMKKDLPNNRIINVFHIEDGMKGLDRLIEYSDYIAISVPELRFAGRKKYVPQLARYIKNKKPNIDIHLLGCTEIELLRQCNFCTSSDSTSYLASKRYGFLEGRHHKWLNTEKIIDYIGKEKYDYIMQFNKESNTNTLVMHIETLKQKYQKVAGNQDYYAEIK